MKVESGKWKVESGIVLKVKFGKWKVELFMFLSHHTYHYPLSVNQFFSMTFIIRVERGVLVVGYFSVLHFQFYIIPNIPLIINLKGNIEENGLKPILLQYSQVGMLVGILVQILNIPLIINLKGNIEENGLKPILLQYSLIIFRLGIL